MNQVQKIEISTWSIVKVFIVLVGLAFLYAIKDILFMIFIAIIISAAVDGPIDWLQKRRLKRIVGVIIIYLIFFSIIGLALYLILPPLADQVGRLAKELPNLLEKLGVAVQTWQIKYHYNFEKLLTNFGEYLQSATKNILATTINIFGGLFSAVVILVISIYLSAREQGVKKMIISITPEEHKSYISDLVDRMQEKLGSWLRGQLVLMLTVGVLVYIGLIILGINYALILAILAGLLEIIPYLGPVLSVIPAAIIGFLQSPVLGVAVLILYYAIQQLENYVLAPQIMKKAVGLDPVIIIVVMMIGLKLGGITGIIVSVPLAAIISVALTDLFESRLSSGA